MQGSPGTVTKGIPVLRVWEQAFNFTTGNSFLGTKLIGFSKGRGSGAQKGLIARTCKVFRFARKFNTAPADFESRPRAPQRVGSGLGLGLGSGWSGQRNRRFVRACTYGAAILESLSNVRANLKNLSRTCNFAGVAGIVPQFCRSNTSSG